MTFDWATLAFQTVNVAILIWLLSRIFWAPMARFVVARREEVASLLAEAEASRRAAEDAAAEVESARADIAAERREALAAAHRAADAERQTVLGEAEAAARSIVARAKDRIAKERRAAEAAYATRAGDLALAMAERIGRRLDGPALRAAALETLVADIGALPEPDRAALRAASDVVVSTASALAPAERQTIAERLAAALGGDASLEFRMDPAFVAGLQIAAPHLVVSETWQDRLERMGRDLGNAS